MCAAVLGQCGPRVPRFKSLFHSQRYSDELSFLRGERQTELQSIWQDIGDDKYVKLEELRQTIAAAVDKIYESALEEGTRQRMALQDMVTKSENRLKEYLGSTALQVIAPKELPLQARLNMNMSRLQDLDNARLGGYGWVGGLVVLVELRHRVAVLREMLKLPPCDTFADLDEVLASTTEALHNLCSGKITCVPTFHPLKSDQKPIFQRLQRFYQTLCAMENFCQDSFLSKEAVKGFKDLHCSEASAQFRLQELEFKAAKDRNMDFDKLVEERGSIQLANSIASFGFAKKRASSKFGCKIKETKHMKQHSEDASKLELLSCKILKKLEDINRHVVCVTKSADVVFSPFSSYSQISDIEYSPSSGLTSISDVSKGFSHSLRSASMSPASEDNGVGTPTSVLPKTITKTYIPSYHLSLGISPIQWQEASGASCNKKESPLMLLHQQDDPSESLDVCWVQQYENDLAARGHKNDVAESRPKEHKNTAKLMESANSKAIKTFDSSFRATKTDAATQKHQEQGDVNVEKETMVSVTCGQRSTALPKKKSTTLALALPPPPPPPRPPASAPPPPPPPPPSLLGSKRQLASKSTKLKKSSTISRLYMGMKRKVDGVDNLQSTLTDGVMQRRMVAIVSTRTDGMAEALAEITRRSSYFRKIEDDVHKHAASIIEIKAGLESFETRDMQKLLLFHESIEGRLEQLTDESQVLARFEGFPIKKLETVRAAASLYLRMRSLAHQIENWPVEPPMSDNIDKITNFFDKVKTDVEVIERTKDEDISRFHGQNIFLTFEIIGRIKEAVVGLSSRSLALAMKESQRTKGSIRIGDEYLSSKEMNKLRGSFQMMWKVFQLAFRAHNLAGGHDDKAEQLCCNLAKEMDTYPSSFWLELVNK